MNSRSRSDAAAAVLSRLGPGITADLGDCPWSGRIADRLARAPGSVDARALMAEAPEERDLVVAHGDFCLPNVLLSEDGSVAGFIDWAHSGSPIAQRISAATSGPWNTTSSGPWWTSS